MPVTIAAWGRTMRDRGSSSPDRLMPSSKMPKAESAGMRARLSGTPQWLLWLAALAWVAAWPDSARRRASLVLVLPTLPVTAMTCALARARAAAASARSAAAVSATRSRGASALTARGCRLTMAAAAPAARASAT